MPACSDLITSDHVERRGRNPKAKRIAHRGVECCAASFQRLADAFGDYSRIVVDGEGYGALESVPAGNEYAEPALERIGGDPPFVWRAGMLAAGDYRRLNTLATVAWDPSDVEDGERHTA